MSDYTTLPKAPEKYFERYLFLQHFPVEALIQRLCHAHQIEDVLKETGLRRDELRKILKRSPVPLPSRLCDLRRFRQSVFENARLHDIYLERTRELRSALTLAQNELTASYDLPWEV